MTASTRSASNVLLLLCSSAAIIMTFTGMLFLIATRLLSIFAHRERFLGEIDLVSIALIFVGIAATLKTIELRLRAEQSPSTD